MSTSTSTSISFQMFYGPDIVLTSADRESIVAEYTSTPRITHRDGATRQDVAEIVTVDDDARQPAIRNTVGEKVGVAFLNWGDGSIVPSGATAIYDND